MEIKKEKENMTITMKAKDDVFYLDGQPYSIADVWKVDVLFEDAKWKGKTAPFVHQIAGGGTSTTAYALFEPKGYVGLRIQWNDQILADYVSENPVYHNTDAYRKDCEKARDIQRKLLKNQRLHNQKREE